MTAINLKFIHQRHLNPHTPFWNGGDGRKPVNIVE